MDDLYNDYDPSSISGRLDKAFSAEAARRITLPLPDDLKSSFPPGVPKYNPAAMPHSTFHETQLRPNYVPPLSYYVLHALQPYYALISPLEHPLPAQVLVGHKRVSVVDVILPYAKYGTEYVDPATWAILIQIFDVLPECYSKFALALNDAHLTTLANIPSTPNFSIVTFLDLSGCNELLDENISFLKVLSSLCVFDASRTRLTDQGVKNFKSTLFLREPGPVYLRSWSLRMCEGITAKVLGSFRSFPLLCVLDLRETSVLPSEVQSFWPKETHLPALENMEYFAPNPQHRIPGLLQQLAGSSFLCSEGDPTAKSPYVIHVDRVRPKPLSHHRPPTTGSFSRIGKNAYHVSASYAESPKRAGHCWSGQRHHIDDMQDTCDAGSYGFYESDLSTDYISSEDEGSINSEGMQSESEEASDDDSHSVSSSRQSPGEVRHSLSPIHQSATPPLSTFSDSSCPSSPVMDDFSTNTTLQPTLHAGPSSSAPVGGPASQCNNPSNSLFPLTTTIEPVSSGGNLDHSILKDVFKSEVGNIAQEILGFFNPRAQAGLAPPKRRRMKRYPSESSRSYDSDEERKRRRLEFSDFGDVELALLRKPPPWKTVQKLIDAKTKFVATERLRSLGKDNQGAGAQPSAQLAKTEKSTANTALAGWNFMLASSCKNPTPSSDNSGLVVASSSGEVCNRQSSFSATLPRLSQTKDKPVRRTTIGRLPKDPGTIVRKAK